MFLLIRVIYYMINGAILIEQIYFEVLDVTGNTISLAAACIQPYLLYSKLRKAPKYEDAELA